MCDEMDSTAKLTLPHQIYADQIFQLISGGSDRVALGPADLEDWVRALLVTTCFLRGVPGDQSAAAVQAAGEAIRSFCTSER